MRAKMIKTSRLAIIVPVLYLALTVGITLLFSNSTYAGVSDARKTSCKTPINVNNSSSTPYNIFISSDNGFDNLGGGADMGVHWACYDEISGDDFIRSGIMFIASSVDVGDAIETYSGSKYKYPTYKINTTINITSDSGTTPALVSGMVHYNSETQTSNAAEHIGICRYQADCYATSTAKEGAEGRQAGDIFSGFPTYMTRQENTEADKAQSSFGLWSPPTHTTSISINNEKLINSIKNDNNLSVSSDDFRNAVKAGNAADGWVKFYVHRCWAGDSNGCRTSPLYLVVSIAKISNPTHFEGKLNIESVSGGSATKGSDGVYYTDSGDEISVKFKYEMRRKDGEATAKETWKAYYDKDSTSGLNKDTSASKTETNETFSDTNYKTVHTNTKKITLSPGQTKTYCEVLAYYETSENGDLSDFTDGDKAKQQCITIHRYKWYEINESDAAVEPSSSNATLESDGYWYTDYNTANIKFTHKMKSDSASGIYPKFKTSKNPNPGDAFPIVSDYTKSSTLVKTDWTTVYESPATAASVNVAKDGGSTYAQTISWYPKTRDDSGDHKGTPLSTTGEIKLKRYKTTFSGATEIYVNSTKVKDEDGNAIDSTTDIAGKTIYVSDDSYPVDLPLTFKHIVTRSSSDAHGSPSEKSSVVKTTVTKYDEIRASDPHGSDKTETVGPLAAGGKGNVTDTFTAKIYPEHSATFCQQMNYTSEIQGEETTASANADEACVTIVMEHADCLGGQTFGIKNGKNWLKAEIYKNSTASASQTSGVLYQGTDHVITEWAKPGDQVRYKYYGCAGGELARQYKDADTYTTSYSISTDTSGYLFGRKVGKDAAGTYTATATTVGTSSSTDGTGPFSGSFTITVGSPSGDSDTDRMYSCDHYGDNGVNNVYRIPAYISGASESNFREKCKSDDTGRVSDLGYVLKQFATWTDIQYSSGSVVSGHDGSSNAKVTAQIKVPYNYINKVTTSGSGGYIHPGTTHTESIKLYVDKRQNELVNGSTEYVTTTKPSKYQLIQIIVGSNHTGSSTDFDSLVDGDLLFADDNGTKNLATDLTVCSSTYGFNCTRVANSESDKSYDARNNGANGQVIGSYELKVPYNVEPGVKYCYVAAVWPSDSHNDPSLVDIDATANEIALKTGAIAGSKWQVSGATCFTTAKRPNIHILGGDAYAQNYITGHTTKYPEDNNGTNPRIYGSWGEYGLVAGKSIQGFSSGASLWGGSNIISNKPSASLDCIYSALTYANSECGSGTLGSLAIDTAASSNPKNLTDQIKTRYTRSSADAYAIHKNDDTVPLSNAGTCIYNGSSNKYVKDPATGAFDCIGDVGVKYTHVVNKNAAQTASIQSTFCLSKGSDDNNRISVIHADRTLVIGANIIYGTGSECTPESYSSLNEIPQYVFIAKKIVIKQDVTHIDGWLVADEIITCDPGDDWAGTVNQSEINSKNCNKQLTINGPVMTKSLKLYRTYGAGFEGGTNLASPAEIFTMGPDVYLWSFGQAQRYSQATTTYSRELAPRY